MPEKRMGTGATLERVSVEIAHLTSISIGPNRESLDCTAHDSDLNDFREFCRGMIDGAEISVEGFYTGEAEASHAALVNDLFAPADEAPVTWTITFPTDVATTTVSGKAFVTSMPINSPVGELMSFSVTIKWAGIVTFA